MVECNASTWHRMDLPMNTMWHILETLHGGGGIQHGTMCQVLNLA